MSLKVVSVNIEGDKHLDIVADFLAREQADIVCLMEVIESSLDNVLLDYPYRKFAANFRDDKENVYGVAIASKKPWTWSESMFFDPTEPKELSYAGGGITHRPVMVWGEMDGFILGSVHFTWTPDGKDSDDQTRDLGKLLSKLEKKPLLMCGDFNIPRGNENYLKLARKYKDNIPKDIQSTLDPILHYSNHEVPGKLKLIVDYVWSTPEYEVSDVRVVQSVSDHCGLVFNVDLL